MDNFDIPAYARKVGPVTGKLVSFHASYLGMFPKRGSKSANLPPKVLKSWL